MIFRFKQFEVKHSDSLLKVNTDAVLLGASLNSSSTIRHALDIGTGCGIVALMAAQKFEDAFIDAVECDEASCREAAYNFSESKFATRLNAHHIPIQEFQAEKKYDLIFSNPPYFETPDFSKGKNTIDISEGRKKLATQFTLTFEELLYHTFRLLGNGGKFTVILPYQTRNQFVSLASEHQLNLQETIAFRSKENTPFIRMVLCFSSEPVTIIKNSTITLYHQTGKRHEEYILITKEFYL